MPGPLGGAPINGSMDGGKRRGATVKKLKRALKKAGLKTTGKKSTLTRRAKKAHLKVKGGGAEGEGEGKDAAGGRRRSRRSRGFKLF